MYLLHDCQAMFTVDGTQYTTCLISCSLCLICVDENRTQHVKAVKVCRFIMFSAQLAGAHKNKVLAIELREAEARRKKELFYQKAFEQDMARFKAEQKLS